MIDPTSFLPIAYQAATFYARVALAPGRVLPALLGDLGDVLDGDPISLPVPQDAPPEIPRIILTSKDQALRLEVSVARLDFRWQRTSDETAVDLGHFTALALRALESYHRPLGAHPGRVALIVTRFLPHDQPARALAEHFCRPDLMLNEPGRRGPLNRPEQFELHAHKIFDLDIFRVNSWVRFKTGVIKGRRVILVEQDLNTLAEALADTQFSEDQIRAFYSAAILESESLLRLYCHGGRQG